MKDLTIPLTSRQMSWLIFCIMVGTFNYLELYIALTSNVDFERIGILLVICDLFIMYIAFYIDGKYDTNPAHWLGYCLKLKSDKK